MPTGLASCLAVLSDPSFDPSSLLPAKPSTAEGWTELSFLKQLFESRAVSSVAVAERCFSQKVAAFR